MQSKSINLKGRTELLRRALPRHVLLFHGEDGFKVFGRDASAIARDMQYTLHTDLEEPYIKVCEPALDELLAYITRSGCLFGIVEMRNSPATDSNGVRDGSESRNGETAARPGP